MAIELEGLEFQIESKSESATKGVDALVNSLSKLKSLTKGGAGLTSTINQIEKLDKVLESFKSVDKLQKISDSLQSISGMKIKVPDLSGVANQIQEAKDSAVRDVEPAARTEETLAAPTGNGAADSAVREVAPALNEANSSAKSFMSTISSLPGVFRRGFTTGVGRLREMRAELQAIQPVASTVWKGISFIPIHALDHGISKIKQTTSSLGQLFSSLKRIAMYRLIRSAIAALTRGFQEGINNLYQYSSLMGGQFANSMNSLATSAQYLKNSLAAMASPIINALAPAIDFLIGKLVALMNIINQFFARLTGRSTFTAATKATKSWGGATAGAGKAAKKAAKDIKSYTLGIDELNIIEKDRNNGSGGGGGGGGGGFGDMFEELPIDKSISDFADKLKEAFEKGDWKGVGELIGNKINETLDRIDWNGIGHKIGYWINAAIQIAYWTLETINFQKIGQHIAELLNGAFREIDFYTLGKLLGYGLTVIPDILIGIIMTLDWGLVGKSFGNVLKGIFDQLTEWFEKQDWVAIGEAVYTGLYDALMGLDAKGIVKSFAKLLGTAFGSLLKFLGGVLKGVWESIKEYFKGKFEECGGNIPAGLFKGILDAFTNVKTWIVDNIFKPFWDGIKAAFGIHSPSQKMQDIGKDIVDGLYKGIKDFFGGGFETISTWAKKVVEWFKDSGGDGGIVEKFKTTANDMVTGFKDKIGNTYTTVSTNVTTWAAKVKEWFTGGGFGAVNLTTFAGYAWNIIAGFKDRIGSKYGDSRSNLITWASSVRSWFTSDGGVNSGKWEGFASSIITGFKNYIGSYYTTVKSNMTTFGSSVVSWFNKPDETSLFSHFKDIGKNIIRGFIDGVNALWDAAMTKIKNFGKSVISAGKQGTKESSPSKAFREIGAFVVEGFNLGIKDMVPESVKMMNNWLETVNGFSPQLAFGVDTTAWDTFNPNSYTDQIQTNLNTRQQVTMSGFKDDMRDFYIEYVEPTLNRIAEDARRQADKQETTTVQIGNRVISDAVTEQKNADGYRFTK